MEFFVKMIVFKPHYCCLQLHYIFVLFIIMRSRISPQIQHDRGINGCCKPSIWAQYGETEDSYLP